ncbi:DUF3703 domain-containing protein [Aequorivita sp. CIP111184]|uniref:DUF3703 domain-containing protein n=1 Tax=Aequorivita sp. CIP111184 TaxID=2211356 RepID=UPI000DBC3EFF|nr:DUF3703 domain-containing protein [Aequorivita sp. CIP111184]SRX54323.1 hypothetical protein AEQU1_01332 [Aequorivita sp. CIP111184]
MKLYTSLPKELKPFYEIELEKYRTEYTDGNLKAAWHHLERAHILGQKYPFAHTFVHWKMLQFGFAIKSVKEIVGQIPRFLFGGVKSFVGKVPVGNPGGANVPPLKPFPLEKELQDIFIKTDISTVPA